MWWGIRAPSYAKQLVIRILLEEGKEICCVPVVHFELIVLEV